MPRARRSTPSGSATRAGRPSRSRSSPGRRERRDLGAPSGAAGRATSPRVRRRAGAPRPDRPAARPRRGRVVVDRRPDGGHGRRAGHRPWRARLVPRRLGRDDGGDDVPVGRPDGRAVHDDDAAPRDRPPAAVRRGIPDRLGRGGLVAYGASSSATASSATSWRGFGRTLVRRRRPRPRRRLRADAAQGRLPREMPQPARIPARLLARRAGGRAAAWAPGTEPGASAAAGR